MQQNSVPPSEPKQQRPLTQAELVRRRRILAARKRHRRRRRRRILLFFICVLLPILLVGLTVGISRMRGEHGGTATETDGIGIRTGTTDSAQDSQTNTPPTTDATTETEEIIPPYTAPNPVTGIPPAPYADAETVTLTEEVSCKYALIAEADTGYIRAWKNASEPIYPASMTKLMTVLVAYEQITDLEATFRMTYEIIDPVYLQGLALAGFVGGEDIPIIDLMYGSALPSGAEASLALATIACGSEEAFVTKMNERAQSLGMKDTHFVNCTGAHDSEHVSTLADIAILMTHVMSNDDLYTIFSTYEHTTTPTTEHPEGLLMHSTVFSRMEGNESVVCEIKGGKTGYTVPAMQCLVTYGIRLDSGKPFVCVTAYGETKWRPVYDSIYLYQYYTQPK